MPEAYDKAAVRHWSDAEFCAGDQRLPNADQLYGFAAECALKTMLVRLPGCLKDGALIRRYKEHVDKLWAVIPVQSVQSAAAGLVPLLRDPMKPFADWSTDQRYEAGDEVTPERVQKHRKAARRVLGAVGLLGERRGA